MGKEWQLNCRPCPPRLLFIFQLNGALRASDAGLWREGDSPAAAAAGAATKLKRHSPKRRLQHALEDQIYHVFRKSRLLTNQSVNCLFTVPANQAFVYVMAEPPDDPVGSLIRCLRSNCSLKEGDGQNAGPRRCGAATVVVVVWCLGISHHRTLHPPPLPHWWWGSCE